MNLLPAFTGAPEPDSIYNVDALTLLRAMPDNSVDAIVTDPPYGLAFMGKRWDYDVPGVDVWAECLRVLKPGGHALVFAGTRTQHRMAVNIEDGGFEIRDMIAWVYGSGFPKSHDISKAIDKEAGAVREVVPGKRHAKYNTKNGTTFGGSDPLADHWNTITAPATPEAQAWDGWGSALKPALEPITVARKPLAGTLAANTLAWGVGGLHVDACRVGTEDDLNGGGYSKGFKGSSFLKYGGKREYVQPQGRWPANLVHDGSDEVTALFPVTSSGTKETHHVRTKSKTKNTLGERAALPEHYPASTGSAARFFYCAKASSSERGESNTHPTVKPIALMEWLIKLVTPAGALIVDPFMGSGTTLLAARNLNRRYIGGDITPEYVQIARERLSVPYTPDMFAWIDGEQSA